MTRPTTGRSTATIRRRRRARGATTTRARSSVIRRASARERPDGRRLQYAQGWIELSSSTRRPGLRRLQLLPERPVQLRQPGRHPPGSGPGTVWYVGSMNYDELKVYDRSGSACRRGPTGARWCARRTRAGTWPTARWQRHDRGARRSEPRLGRRPRGSTRTCARRSSRTDGDTAFIGGDGGVARIDTRRPRTSPARARTGPTTTTATRPTTR